MVFSYLIFHRFTELYDIVLKNNDFLCKIEYVSKQGQKHARQYLKLNVLHSLGQEQFD